MKKWLVFLLLFFILKGLVKVFIYGPLFQVDSFYIFYGHPDSKTLRELAKRDAAIIEPSAFTNRQLSILQKEGVILFGYVSLMQLENWNEELKKHVLPSDYALHRGKRIYIAEWDTYVMDISKARYRELLMQKIHNEIILKKLDGIFFDTVDDLDYYFRDDPAIENAMRNGYRKLLDEIKSAYPDLLIIQNRGFGSYKAISRTKVDGILWEGFKKGDLENSEWARNWHNYWKKEQCSGRARVFTVVTDEASLAQSRNDRFPAFMRTKDTYQ